MIKNKFDELGIELPFTQITLHNATENTAQKPSL
jgi:small-conductance mechanosensitive channel